MEELLKNILPLEKIDEFISIGQIKNLNSGDYFIREGEVPKKMAFIVSGLFRYVYINDKGLEFTKGIVLEHHFITSYSAMISNSTSHFFIEALEDAQVFEFSYKRWKILIESDPFWVRFILKIIEKGFTIKEKRERDLLLLNAETRYLNFLKEFPEIEKRIKQTIIASYLGIQPESLSRIKKKLT